MGATGIENIKDIDFKKDVVKTTKYKYSKVAVDYMEYIDWKCFERRRKTCFACGVKFKDGDLLSLLFDGNKLNTVCCHECAVTMEQVIK